MFRTLRALALLVPLAAPLAAQSRTLRVVTPDSIPVPYAWVLIGGATGRITDDKGMLSLASLPNKKQSLEVRRIGYTPYEGAIVLTDTSSLITVRLTPNVAKLDKVTVAEGNGPGSLMAFYNRVLKSQKGASGGVYFTPEDIERRQAPEVAQLVRSVNGMKIERASDGGYVAVGAAACQLALAVDGQQVRSPAESKQGNGSQVGLGQPTSDKTKYMSPGEKAAMLGTMESGVGRKMGNYADSNSTKLDRLVGIGSVMAVEVYPRAALIPAELATFDNNCGLIAIWTGMRK